MVPPLQRNPNLSTAQEPPISTVSVFEGQAGAYASTAEDARAKAAAAARGLRFAADNQVSQPLERERLQQLGEDFQRAQRQFLATPDGRRLLIKYNDAGQAAQMAYRNLMQSNGNDPAAYRAFMERYMEFCRIKQHGTDIVMSG